MKHSLPIKKLKKLFGEREGKFILVTGGGSADASYFMDKFIDAVRLLHSKIKINALIGIGPFMHRDQRQLLRNKAKGLPIAVAKTGQASIQYLKRADLVISMCGYNTMTEILNFRKKCDYYSPFRPQRRANNAHESFISAWSYQLNSS